MATIVLLHHPYDRFIEKRRLSFRPGTSRFMIKPVLDILAERKHHIRYCTKPARMPKADLVILHPNLSVVPPEYLAAAARAPVSINGTVADITKRTVSQTVIDNQSTWSGPVIVKSNLNFHGLPEVTVNRVACRRFRTPPYRGARLVLDYDVYDTMADVPSECWDDPALVVEKYVPEILPDGYGMRTYIFCGPAERCLLHVSPQQIIKSDNIIRSENVDVPPALRETRNRLGFDFGKFDFVMHNGVPLLIDANKTPTGVQAEGDVAKRIAAGNIGFADGVESFL